MTLVIDNYDSFTYNLVQYMGQLGEEIMVRRNDEVTVDEVEAINPARLVISPGPGRPEKAGISVEAVRRFGSRVPILGVCLGHQAIGVAFGGMVVRNRLLRHGFLGLYTVFNFIRNRFCQQRDFESYKAFWNCNVCKHIGEVEPQV